MNDVHEQRLLIGGEWVGAAEGAVFDKTEPIHR